jgi:hypothetical protein
MFRNYDTLAEFENQILHRGFSQARQLAIMAAAEAGHEKIVPRDPTATQDELADWVRSRYCGAITSQQKDLAWACEGFAQELGIVLPEIKG